MPAAASLPPPTDDELVKITDLEDWAQLAFKVRRGDGTVHGERAGGEINVVKHHLVSCFQVHEYSPLCHSCQRFPHSSCTKLQGTEVHSELGS